MVSRVLTREVGDGKMVPIICSEPGALFYLSYDTFRNPLAWPPGRSFFCLPASALGRIRDAIHSWIGS